MNVSLIRNLFLLFVALAYVLGALLGYTDEDIRKFREIMLSPAEEVQVGLACAFAPSFSGGR